MGMLCSSPQADDVGGISAMESDRTGLRSNLVRQKTNRNPWFVYEKGDTLGSGHTGSVWRVTKRGTGEQFALKSIKLNCIDETLLDDLRNEIELLKMVRRVVASRGRSLCGASMLGAAHRLCGVQMDHPNIIKLIETYEDETAIYLVMELCAGGELYDRLQDQRGSRFSEEIAANLIMKMLSSVAYCHRKNISHRDLKCVPTRLLCSPLVPLWIAHARVVLCGAAGSKTSCSKTATTA